MSDRESFSWRTGRSRLDDQTRTNTFFTNEHRVGRSIITTVETEPSGRVWEVEPVSDEAEVDWQMRPRWKGD